MNNLSELNYLTEIARKHIVVTKKQAEENKRLGNEFYKWMKSQLNDVDKEVLENALKGYLQDTLNSTWHKLKHYGGMKAKKTWCVDYDYHKFSCMIKHTDDYDLYAKINSDADWLIIYNVKNAKITKMFHAYKNLAQSKENKIAINLNFDDTIKQAQTAVNTPFGQMTVVAALEHIEFPHMENQHLLGLRINMNPYFAKSLAKAGYNVTKSGNLLHFTLNKDEDDK